MHIHDGDHPTGLGAGGISFGAPQKLFDAPGLLDFDAAADGRRFLVQLVEKSTGSSQVVLVANALAAR